MRGNGHNGKELQSVERLELPKGMLERGDLSRHTGHNVIWYDGAGHENTGTIALIANNT
jgi:hypothetical protein